MATIARNKYQCAKIGKEGYRKKRVAMVVEEIGTIATVITTVKITMTGHELPRMYHHGDATVSKQFHHCGGHREDHGGSIGEGIERTLEDLHARPDTGILRRLSMSDGLRIVPCHRER